MDEWYYQFQGKRVGPITRAALQKLADAGKLRTTDLVWTDGLEKWRRAAKVEGLFGDLAADATRPSANGEDTSGEQGGYRPAGLKSGAKNYATSSRTPIIIGTVIFFVLLVVGVSFRLFIMPRWQEKMVQDFKENREAEQSKNKSKSKEEEILARLKQVDMQGTAGSLMACDWFEKNTSKDKELRSQVALHLMDVAEKGDPFMTGSAARALPNWCTDEIAPRLLTMVRGTQNRQGPIIAVGKLKYDKAIPDLVRFLETGEERNVAVKSLIEMGPVAESAMLKIITDNDLSQKTIQFAPPTIGAVRAATEVLVRIGTAESLPTLEALRTRAADGAVRGNSGQAVDAIKKRAGTK